MSDVFGNIARPALSGIEAHNADGVAVLPFEEISEDALEIGGFNICFWPDAPEPAEILDYHVNILIVVLGYD
jgi:hypothetical protein